MGGFRAIRGSHCRGFRVWGLGVWGLGFGVQVLRFTFWVQCLGLVSGFKLRGAALTRLVTPNVSLTSEKFNV